MERKRLRDLRNSKNLLQKDVANAVGITTSYYGMIEQGVRTPTINIAMKIAELFNTTIEDIFFEDIDNLLLIDNNDNQANEMA